ncbi:MAG: allophanate hydrolase subunit 1 [Pseudomonadota bacterium]
MIYDPPRFLPGGDRFLLIEFGDEMTLELNFLAQDLAAQTAAQKLTGVIETAPCFATLLVHYEPDEIDFADLVKEMTRLYEGVDIEGDFELPSRLLSLPAVYLDPWTEDAMKKYRDEINPDKEPDPEFIAGLNDLADVDQFVRVHAGTEYWVAALGFWPGTPFMMPLDPRCKLVAPKYNPPRTFTPKGTIGMGGSSTAIYPVDGPGGYQIFARTPVPIWDMNRGLPQFEQAPYLLRPTDRLKFIPCSVEEFEAAERQVSEGTYQINIAEYQKISLKQYKHWVSGLDMEQRF